MQDVYIPDEMMDAVVDRISASDDEGIRTLMKRAGPFQPELTAFTLAYTRELSPATRALAMIGMLTAFEAFREGYLKTRKARERLVRRWLDEARDVVAELADEFRSAGHVTVEDLMSSEPPLMDALLDLACSTSESDTSLDGEEGWHLLTVLHTVVETLHECAGAPRFEVDHEPLTHEDDVRPSMTIGLAWYTPDQWQRMRDTAEDADDLEDTYAEWLATAEQAERELAKQGATIVRVMVDVDQLLAWLDQTGRRATAASRSVYALELTEGVAPAVSTPSLQTRGQAGR